MNNEEELHTTINLGEFHPIKMDECPNIVDAQWRISLTSPYKIEVEMVRTALDKQIPKKPTRVSASEGCYLCPICGSKRISNMSNDKFCRDCGQAISWEE